jgi:hypothetical protein
MSGPINPTEDRYKPGLYEIRIKGELSDKWADRFESMTITMDDEGNTLLTGPVSDQAALHGYLKIIRDLGLTLISVGPVEHGRADQSDVKS